MAKPSAVTEIETIPYSVRVWKMCVFSALCVVSERVCACVACRGKQKGKKCAIVAYHIIKKNER